MGDRVHSPGKHKRLCDCGVMVTCNLAKVESPVRFWAVAPNLADVETGYQTALIRQNSGFESRPANQFIASK